SFHQECANLTLKCKDADCPDPQNFSSPAEDWLGSPRQVGPHVSSKDMQTRTSRALA
ncbi:unnamed protein product, partial [Allacma fusca]